MGARILLLAHAPLASAWCELARHTYAECVGELETLDIDPGDSLEAAQTKLRARLQQGGERPTLVLVDVPGATPANALQALLPEFPEVRAVTGLNAPMLWRTLCYREAALDELAERAEGGGVRGIIRLN
jgi:mannose PTS system EIIA component